MTSFKIKEATYEELYNIVKHISQLFYRRFRYSNEISRDKVATYLIREFVKRSDGMLQLVYVNPRGEICGGTSVYLSKWDTEHFGLNIGKTSFLYFDESVEINDRILFFQELRKLLFEKEIQVVFMRHFLDDTKTTIAITKAGGVLADVLLTFHRNVKDFFMMDVQNSLVQVRDAQESDEHTIVKIARNAFRTSHFYSDPKLPTYLSDELYAKWSSNSLKDLSNKVLVAEKNNSVIGFIILSTKTLEDVPYGVIDLIAVDPNERGLGIGKLLLLKALSWFSSKVSSVYVGTQANNIPAVRLYEGNGFKLVEAEATLHLWI